MIEVNMTVNELTEDANMEVSSSIHYEGLKNPLVHLTVINNYEPSFPPRTAVVEGLYYENGILKKGGIGLLPQQTGDVSFLAICDNEEDRLYYFYLEETSDMETSVEGNLYYEESADAYRVLDPSQDAYLTVVFGEF